MKTEPTDEEINSAIAKFCGWRKCACGDLECGAWFDTKDESQLGPPSFTTSFDVLREAMGKMTEEQQKDLRNKLVEMYEENRRLLTARSAIDWLLFHCSVRTLAEAVYEVVKGENKNP